MIHVLEDAQSKHSSKEYDSLEQILRDNGGSFLILEKLVIKIWFSFARAGTYLHKLDKQPFFCSTDAYILWYRLSLISNGGFKF